jgi:hypothetical protein
MLKQQAAILAATDTLPSEKVVVYNSAKSYLVCHGFQSFSANPRKIKK